MARFLVIDDSSFQRNLLEELLREFGHDSVVAPNGAMGLELLEDESVDGILVDLIMPILDGYGFLKALGKLESAPPAVVVTADDYDYVRDRCQTLGALELLSKPVERGPLAEALEILLNTKSC